MNKNIIEFYLEVNNLKNVVRTGWKEVGIPTDKVESVADHVYGTSILALSLIEEKGLSLNTEKVLKMILVRELAKTVTNREDSVLSGNTRENFKEITKSLFDKLTNGDKLFSVYEEYDAMESEESKFVYKVAKLESDLQAKIYEKKGYFTVENAVKDVENYPEDIKAKVGQVTKASDGWLTFDREYYDDELFMSLSNDIQNL